MLGLRVAMRRFATKAAGKKPKAAVAKRAAPAKKAVAAKKPVVKKAAPRKVAKKAKVAPEERKKALAAKRAARKERKAKAGAAKKSRAERKAAARKRRQERKAKRAAARTARKQRKAKAAAAKKTRRERSKGLRQRKTAKRAARILSKKTRRVVAKPWRATEKSLPNRAYAAFVKAEFKNERKGSEPATTVIKRLAKRYKNLSAQERAPYQKEAAKNQKVRQAAKDKVKGLRVGPYAFFVRERFSALASNVSGKGKNKIGKVGKQLAAEWKGLSAAQKQQYANKAQSLRAAAQRNVDAMMKKK